MHEKHQMYKLNMYSRLQSYKKTCISCTSGVGVKLEHSTNDHQIESVLLLR